MINLNGYVCFTSFWQDFTIAEKFGVSAIRDTFSRAFKEWRRDYRYLTELVMVLNHKCWDFYNRGNDELCELYRSLYYAAADYAVDHLKEEELSYYLRVTD